MLTLKIFNLQLENQFTTLVYSHCPRFLMERGCNIHANYPEKMFKLKTKLVMVSLILWKVKINVLAKKIHSLLHAQFIYDQ